MIYELSDAEQKGLWALVSEVRARHLTGFTPNAFSIGFNDETDSTPGAEPQFEFVRGKVGAIRKGGMLIETGAVW